MNRRYRKTIIAGNWKMNMTASDTKKFAEDIKAIMPRAKTPANKNLYIFFISVY